MVAENDLECHLSLAQSEDKMDLSKANNTIKEAKNSRLGFTHASEHSLEQIL